MWDAFAARYERETFVEVEPLTDASDADELTFDPQANNETNRISLRVLPRNRAMSCYGAAGQPRQRRSRGWRFRT